MKVPRFFFLAPSLHQLSIKVKEHSSTMAGKRKATKQRAASRKKKTPTEEEKAPTEDTTPLEKDEKVCR